MLQGTSAAEILGRAGPLPGRAQKPDVCFVRTTSKPRGSFPLPAPRASTLMLSTRENDFRVPLFRLGLEHTYDIVNSPTMGTKETPGGVEYRSCLRICMPTMCHPPS